ncbi:hypothetical protein [Caulobacter sp. UNC279MFTsu5.1]|uniref:hypothetical protein n=1 Tax=Caulobacter sp. UNC279MFTsu5.1 TaxID=1502775 RepID=UPI0008E18690|nr:hypothetical protein [Caulobacter sp. UNC279MFTsu5.1]SFI66443.1 hypothetical protein SAMN02799626_00292 [Caulobacter sp. UNC279MFTsu5.1]
MGDMGVIKRVGAGLLLAAAIGGGPALASSQNSGMASSISTGSDGNVWFSHDGARSGTLPSCAASNGLWVFNVGTPAGQAMLANLLAATAAGHKVSIQGTGTCIGDHEAVAYIVGL